MVSEDGKTDVLPFFLPQCSFKYLQVVGNGGGAKISLWAAISLIMDLRKLSNGIEKNSE